MGVGLKKGIISIVALLAISITFFWTKEASAVPAFAKQVGAECTLCHIGFPKLNETGIAFRINGYRMEGDVGQNIWEQDLKNHLGVVAGVEYLNVDMEMPMTADAGGADAGGADAPAEDHRSTALSDMSGDSMGASGGSAMKMKVKSSKFNAGSVFIYLAGTLAPNVSYFTHLLSGGSSTVRGLANVTLMDIAPDAALNLRFGETNIDLPYLSSSRKLTMTNYLIQIAPGAAGHGGAGGHGGATVSGCSACGASLTNVGVDANGIVSLGENTSVEYVLGVGNDGVETSESNIGAYRGYAVLNIGSHSLGIIVNQNRVGEDESSQQSANAIGISADLNFGSFNFMGTYNQFTQGQEHGDDLKINSGALEGTWMISDSILGVARYDFRDTQDSDEKENQVVATLIYYRQPNVKFQAEIAQNTTTDHSGADFKSTGIYGGVSFGF